MRNFLIKALSLRRCPMFKIRYAKILQNRGHGNDLPRRAAAVTLCDVERRRIAKFSPPLPKSLNELNHLFSIDALNDRNVGRTNRNLMSFMQHSLTTLIHSRLCPRRRDRSRACPPSPHPHPSSCPHIICRWINKNWRWIMEWEEGGGRPGDPEGRDDEGKTNLDLIE